MRVPGVLLASIGFSASATAAGDIDVDMGVTAASDGCCAMLSVEINTSNGTQERPAPSPPTAFLVPFCILLLVVSIMLLHHSHGHARRSSVANQPALPRALTGTAEASAEREECACSMAIVLLTPHSQLDNCCRMHIPTDHLIAQCHAFEIACLRAYQSYILLPPRNCIQAH